MVLTVCTALCKCHEVSPTPIIPQATTNHNAGVPVATVGINNSINAALLAVRILGSYEPALQRKVEEYANNAKSENLDIKGTKIKEIGWEKYFAQM